MPVAGLDCWHNGRAEHVHDEHSALPTLAPSAEPGPGFNGLEPAQAAMSPARSSRLGPTPGSKPCSEIGLSTHLRLPEADPLEGRGATQEVTLLLRDPGFLNHSAPLLDIAAQAL